MARPRPVFRARGAVRPSGLGCARLATLAIAPPRPEGRAAQGEAVANDIYRKDFTLPLSVQHCSLGGRSYPLRYATSERHSQETHQLRLAVRGG